MLPLATQRQQHGAALSRTKATALLVAAALTAAVVFDASSVGGVPGTMTNTELDLHLGAASRAQARAVASMNLANPSSLFDAKLHSAHCDILVAGSVVGGLDLKAPILLPRGGQATRLEGLEVVLRERERILAA